MRHSLLPLFALLSLASTSLPACGGEDSEGPEGIAYECYETADCDTDSECSGGSCVPVISCGAEDECDADSSCVDGVCRAHCASDAACEASGLTCDLTENLCIPATNPEPGAVIGDGSGGSTGGEKPQEAGTGGGTGEEIPVIPAEPTIDYIDQLEDGDLEIDATDSRVGIWYTYSDSGASRPRAPLPTLEDGRTAVHAKGSHGSTTADQAYGGLGVDLKNTNTSEPLPVHGNGMRSVYDASEWDGFQFAIKTGAGSTKSVRFEIVTTAIAASGADAGSCSGEGCWDAFGKDVAIDSEWKIVKVPFSAVVQEGWGSTKNFDVSQILGVAFEDRTTKPWDFWVDDLALYKNPPDGGNTGGGAPASCGGDWGGYDDGAITKYWFTQGTVGFGDVNCSYGISNTGDGGNSDLDSVNHVHTGNGTFFGAMNTADYDAAGTCGSCVEVSTDIGTSVTLTIVDQCPIGSNPLCVPGHIDLSIGAYNELKLPAGHYGKGAQGKVSWKYVPCPSKGNASFRLKEPNNANWNMVIVENHIYPIAKVEVETDRGWLAASREDYNFWLPPGGNMGNGNIRATDVNGSIVTGTAKPATSSGQFVCE